MRKFAAAVALVGVFSFVVGGVAWAAKAPNEEAIEHTKEAIEHGKAGHADVLTKHAEMALKITMAEKGEHAAEAAKHLQGAVDAGKKGDAAGGTKHAQEALTHLQAK